MTDHFGKPILDEERFRVNRGEITDAGNWVYIWLEADPDNGILYVGATGVPPAVRTWLHLHDDDPNVGRVSHRYTQIESSQATVVAYRIDSSLNRKGVKGALIELSEERGLRASDYFGEVSPAETASQEKQDAANIVVSQLQERE